MAKPVKEKTVFDKYKEDIAKIVKSAPESIRIECFSNREWKQVEDIVHEDAKPRYQTLMYRVYRSDLCIAWWNLHEMHCCCAIMVSTGAGVYRDYRNKGLGTLLNSLRIELAKLMGYSCLMCTDVEQNTHQRKILAKNGWKDIHSVVNKRTNNNVFISVINI